jgi:hypothetical protein
MNLTAFPADRPTTLRMLNDLALDLTRSDAELTDAVNRGNRVGAGWDTWFSKAANRMLDVREAYEQLQPNDVDTSQRLRSDALDLAASGGQMYAAYTSGHTFGAGWDTTLDRKIADVQEASNRLFTLGGEQPVPPAPPVPGTSNASADAQRASDLIRQSIEQIQTVPVSDHGDESTKAARIAAYHLNLQAQQALETQFTNSDASVVSTFRTADAHLEDANWQLAKKPSPDGRFTGVDIPGALRDSQAALDALAPLTAN